MVQSPSWEATWFAAIQEIPRFSQNPKVHYRTHKRPPPVSILGQHKEIGLSKIQLARDHRNTKIELITMQQDVTYSVYYIYVGRSTCFVCWHPSSGAGTAVIFVIPDYIMKRPVESTP